MSSDSNPTPDGDKKADLVITQEAEQVDTAIPKAPALRSVTDYVDIDDQKTVRRGWLIFILGFCGFMAWAAFAPLDQGSVVPATLVVEGNRKTIQHLNGGLIEKILVKEGQLVSTGDVLVEINPVRSKAELEALRARWISLSGGKARLLAEISESKKVTYPKWFSEHADDERVQDTISLQNQLFESRTGAYRAELAGMQEGLAAQQEILSNHREGVRTRQEVLRIKEEQLSSMKEMVDAGYMPRVQYMDAMRDYNTIATAVAQDSGQISQFVGRIAEIKQQIAQRRSAIMADIQTELSNVQANLEEAEQSLRSANFNTAINKVRSPVDGYVVGLRVYTEGGVITPGQPLMDIAPKNSKLELTGALEVSLVDQVSVGMPVAVAFSSLNHAHTPEVTGIVKTVAADSLIDEHTGQPYYPIRFSINDEDMQKLSQYAIQPGVPAEVFINTGERTMLNYLFKPLTDRMRSALTEE